MKLKLRDNGGTVKLNKNNFKASGGEGSIYIIGSLAYKVYTDPNAMIPFGKIRELQAMNIPYIISPRDVLLDSSGKPVGYEMRAVPESFTLAETFAPAFRRREGLTHDKMFGLVKKIRDGVHHAHEKDVLIVDMNELNFLVGKSFEDVFFIDCDSYQTRSFPATAIMENIRDPKVVNNKFSTLSDWFSFAVLSFQMMTAVSPYRGRHPSVKSVQERKEKNISVFNPEVRVPRSAYYFDVIPDLWRAWYKAVLEDGKRIAPPMSDIATIVVAPQVKVVPKGAANLEVFPIFSNNSEIKDAWAIFSHRIFRDSSGFWYNGRQFQVSGDLSNSEVGFTRGNSAVALISEGNAVRVVNFGTGFQGDHPLSAEQLSSVDGRIYAKVGAQVMELTFTEAASGKTVVSSKVACKVLPKASRLFSGCVVQDLLGSVYVSLFPRSGVTQQVKISELDGYKIIDAKATKNVLVVMGNKGGKYDRFVFRMDKFYKSYDVRVEGDVSLSPVNFIQLDSGVCVLLNEAEDLELFSSRKDSSAVKIVKDNFLSGDMNLYTDGADVLYARGKVSERVKMK